MHITYLRIKIKLLFWTSNYILGWKKL